MPSSLVIRRTRLLLLATTRLVLLRAKNRPDAVSAFPASPFSFHPNGATKHRKNLPRIKNQKLYASLVSLNEQHKFRRQKETAESVEHGACNHFIRTPKHRKEQTE